MGGYKGITTWGLHRGNMGIMENIIVLLRI